MGFSENISSAGIVTDQWTCIPQTSVRRGTTILSGCTTRDASTSFTSSTPLLLKAFGDTCSLTPSFLLAQLCLPRLQTTYLTYYRTYGETPASPVWLSTIICNVIVT